MSIDYYNLHADAFVADTLAVAMQSLYDRFLPYLAPGAHILDAGCGSGRDAHHFLQQGFRVSAFDASAELVRRARQWSGVEVACCRFDEYQTPDQVDGIWACASLLHVPHERLQPVFAHLASLLRQGGIFYCSFKYGSGERQQGGRCFTDLDEQGLHSVLSGGPLACVELWQTGDQRPGRESERWLNALLRKS